MMPSDIARQGGKVATVVANDARHSRKFSKITDITAVIDGIAFQNQYFGVECGC